MRVAPALVIAQPIHHVLVLRHVRLGEPTLCTASILLMHSGD
jgi:hypothetical protein